MTQCLTYKWIRVTYSAPVGRCVRQLRVLPPPSRGAQRILNVQWRCEPEQDTLKELTDDFGNRILELQHARMQRELIWAVELQTQSGIGVVGRNEGVPATGIGAFLLPSALCDVNLEIERAVTHLRETQQIGPKAVEESAERLCAWSHRVLEYSTNTTDARTTVSQALARGKGVCQDYAHIMIALCRNARIPARYVSGYLRAKAPCTPGSKYWTATSGWHLIPRTIVAHGPITFSLPVAATFAMYHLSPALIMATPPRGFKRNVKPKSSQHNDSNDTLTRL
jgi:transglutaminase-like putative cysteine protease